MPNFLRELNCHIPFPAPDFPFVSASQIFPVLIENIGYDFFACFIVRSKKQKEQRPALTISHTLIPQIGKKSDHCSCPPIRNLGRKTPIILLFYFGHIRDNNYPF